MVPVSDMNRSPAAKQSFILMIEPLQPIQIMEVPGERSMFSVDLKGIKCLVTSCVPSCLEGRQRSILKPPQERAGIIDAHLFHFTGQIVLPLLDKCFGYGRDGIHFTIQPDCRVNAVSQQIARYPAAGHVDGNPPHPRTTLWHIGRDRPILEEFCPIVKDSTEFARREDL